jgi:hypothetical protein
MVAHPRLDVLILALTCTVAAAVRARRQRPRRHVRPASTGCGRLLAAVCAKYVPKFQAATLMPGGAHAQRGEPVPALPLLLQLPQAMNTDGGQ